MVPWNENPVIKKDNVVNKVTDYMCDIKKMWIHKVTDYLCDKNQILISIRSRRNDEHSMINKSTHFHKIHVRTRLSSYTKKSYIYANPKYIMHTNSGLEIATNTVAFAT